ncbi:MAG: ABC transporter permease, partial [Actinomycetota bacterium]
MIRLALRNLWEHKVRTLLLGMAIVAGVGFVSAAYVFTDSLGAAFDEAFAAGATGIDIQVLPEEEGDGPGGGGSATFPRIPADLVETVSRVDGVEAATPTLQGFVTLVVEGEETQPFGPPDFGINWTDTGPFETVNGAPPTSPGEVMMDAATAESRGVALGDTIEVAGVGRAEGFEVVGT